MGLAYAIGGKWGLGFFAVQAFVAVFHLEITNYIEHYGLTRAYKGAGKYEHVKLAIRGMRIIGPRIGC